jgi:hypothetical protein
MWKRILELLAWIHQSGWAHGAVLPEHLLVHARDHGVVLSGYAGAGAPGSRPLALPTDLQGFVPEGWQGRPIEARVDIAMSARVILHLLSGDPSRASERTPAPLAALLESHARWAPGPAGEQPIDDAWALKDRLDAVAREVFGPPRFVPFAMPGW